MVSAFPPVDQWVALVVHVLYVDDCLFACSGSIAVDTLRTEQRNVERAKRISVDPYQRLRRPSRSSQVSRARKTFHVVCAFSWYIIMAP